MGRVRKLVLKMPVLKNTFLQLKNVQEWVNSNIHLETNQKKPQRNPHHFLIPDLFKPDMGILVISANKINNIFLIHIGAYEIHCCAATS